MIHIAFSVLHSYDVGSGSQTAITSLYFSVVPGIIRKLIKTILPLWGRTNVVAAEKGLTYSPSTHNPGREMHWVPCLPLEKQVDALVMIE